MIVMQKLIKVDGRVRTDLNFPAGFMDVLELDKSNERFRMLYDTKGRFVLHEVPAEEAKYKLCRITGEMKQARGVPAVVTHDGRTLRYPDPIIKVNDTVKLDLATGKVLEVFKFRVGNTVMVTKGRSTGRVGVLTKVEKHDGSFDIVEVKDNTGAVFATRLPNVRARAAAPHYPAAAAAPPRGASALTHAPSHAHNTHAHTHAHYKHTGVYHWQRRGRKGLRRLVA